MSLVRTPLCWLISLKIQQSHIVVRMGAHISHDHLGRGIQSIKLNTPGIAVVLVNILKRNSDLETVKHTTEWLQCLSQDSSVLLSIYESNGIPVLIRLLNAPEECVSINAVKTLSNLIFNLEGSKAAVLKADGLEKMVMALKSHNEMFLSFVMACLHAFAYKNPVNKSIIYFNDGPAKLLRIMETCRCIVLLRITANVLQVLSVCSKNKHAIIAAGGVQVLAKHLYNSCPKLVIICLFTLRNLSDAATEEVNVSPLLKNLVQFLRSGDESIVRPVVGILSNMTCNNPKNKMLICQDGGVRALVKVILMFGNDAEIIERAFCTLRILTSRHPEAETAQNDVRLHYGLQTIAKCLSPPIRWPLIKAVVGLVANLALCPNNREPLLSLGIVHKFKDMLYSIYQIILRNRENIQQHEIQPTVIDGVEMEDIVEHILMAFRNLARNATIRTLLKDSNIMKTFIQIMNKENRKIYFIVSGIFSEFFRDPDGSFTIECIEGVPYFYYSLRLNNEGAESQQGY